MDFPQSGRDGPILAYNYTRLAFRCLPLPEIISSEPADIYLRVMIHHSSVPPRVASGPEGREARDSMCFSAKASLGAAVVLLPLGAYCVEGALRKDRHYLPLAFVPILFGLQQLCEAWVWHGIHRTNSDSAELAARTYLVLALIVWPAWIPLAAGFIESGVKRWIFFLLATSGLILGLMLFLPISHAGPHPQVIGHSIRYDLSAASSVDSFWWGWMAIYLSAVSLPLLSASNKMVRPIGAGVLVFALISAVAFEHAFASVWCFFAAVLSAGLAYIIARLPGESIAGHEPSLLPMPSN